MRGTISAPWEAACSRCLVPVGGELAVRVGELYERQPLEGETYLLGEDDVIDLEPLIRDALLLELPAVPLCRPDCKGLCATCGIDHNLDRLRMRRRRTRPPLGGAALARALARVPTERRLPGRPTCTISTSRFKRSCETWPSRSAR